MRPIRQRPAWQVKQLLQQSGVTQLDIAKACGVSPSLVSHTINRGPVGTARMKDLIWVEIERVTAALFLEKP